MKTPALSLLVGLSIATPLAADSGGELCPFGPTDPQLWFNQVQGPFELEQMDEVTPSGSLPCGFAAVIDEGRPWVGVDVASLPRHLAVTVDLDAGGLHLQAHERIDVLEVLSPLPPYLLGPGSAATVSLSRDELILTWQYPGDKVVASRSRPDGRFTLVLGIDRGRAGADGRLTLFVAGEAGPKVELSSVDLGSFPIAGSPAASVRIGVVATSPIDLGVGETRGWLRFRPVAIESGWGRK